MQNNERQYTEEELANITALGEVLRGIDRRLRSQGIDFRHPAMKRFNKLMYPKKLNRFEQVEHIYDLLLREKINQMLQVPDR